jgi:hypothetical protein
MNKTIILCIVAVAVAPAWAQKDVYELGGPCSWVIEDFDVMADGAQAPGASPFTTYWTVFQGQSQTDMALNLDGPQGVDEWGGRASGYNAGPFTQAGPSDPNSFDPDRALALYQSQEIEESYLETTVHITEENPQGVEIWWDHEVHWIRFGTGSHRIDLYELWYSIDGGPMTLLNSSLIDNFTTTAPPAVWLDDAAAEAGGLVERDIYGLIPTPLPASTMLTLRWQMPNVTDPAENQNMNSGIDNLRIHCVPEPASVALLSLGGLAILRRRR